MSGEPFRNVYEDAERASSYAGLEFPGTYYLGFRDLPALFSRHVHGTRALDFGCGTGRSTRFLRQLGFDAVGVDISPAMLAEARARDPGGRYELIGDGVLDALDGAAFDLVLAAFTFDNIPTSAAKLRALGALRARLAPDGRLVILVSAPEIYLHEWASFSTSAFPENRTARPGDRVRIVMLDVPDQRPVDDVLTTDEDYRALAGAAGLEVVEVAQPLGRRGEGFEWVSEEQVPPWAIYVFRTATGRHTVPVTRGITPPGAP